MDIVFKAKVESPGKYGDIVIKEDEDGEYHLTSDVHRGSGISQQEIETEYFAVVDKLREETEEYGYDEDELYINIVTDEVLYLS